jgi:hypothetical protein
MSKLDTIVTEINTSLKAGVFGSNRFQRGKMFGIAEKFKISETETIPCIMNDSGEDTAKVSIDDTYPFQLYHRILSIDAEYAEEDYGDSIEVIETANMKLVVIGNRSVLRLKKEDIVSGIISALPSGVGKAVLSSLNISECDIDYGEFTTEPQEVYDDEYNIEEYLLKPETIMVAMPYTIVTKYRKGCFDFC